MFLLVYLFGTYVLIFDGHTSWSQSLGICFMVGLRYYWVSRLGKIRNIFLRHGVSIDVENALLVLYCTQSLASVTCFSQQSQDVRMNHFFCVNAFLCYSSVPIPMPAIYSCRAIRQHVLCFSDCPTSFTLLFLTLSLLLMVHARCRLFFIRQLLLATWCVRQVEVLPMSPQILNLVSVMHDLLPIFYFFNYFEFIVEFWWSASFCGAACCHLGRKDFGLRPERNLGR